MNVFPNVAPNKFVTFNGRNPAGMTSNIKDEINYPKNIYREYLRKKVSIK